MRISVFIVAGLLVGCAGQPMAPSAPAAGNAGIPGLASMSYSTQSKQDDVGKRRWLTGAAFSDNFCPDKSMKGKCEKLGAVAVTALAVEDSPTDIPNFNVTVYRVKLDNGKVGYIPDLDFQIAGSEEDHKRDVAAKADCDRRGGVSVGMSADQVRSSCWGKPQRVNRTVTGRLDHEQWVYRSGNYVYLDGGIVTSIQTSR